MLQEEIVKAVNKMEATAMTVLLAIFKKALMGS